MNTKNKRFGLNILPGISKNKRLRGDVAKKQGRPSDARLSPVQDVDGSNGSNGLPTITSPTGKGETSYLVKETSKMMREQRETVQQGLRSSLGVKVHERNHEENENPSAGLEGGLQNSIMVHPKHGDSQRFDGVEPSVSPVPALNTDARKAYDEALKKQLDEKQHRMNLQLGLENDYDFTNTPKNRPR